MRQSLLLVLALAFASSSGEEARAQSAGDPPQLIPTVHAPLPAQPSRFWLVPDQSARAAATRATSPTARFVRGARLIADGQAAAGLALVRGVDLEATPLAPYAQYYEGRALVALGRLDEAEITLAALDKSGPAGHLEEAVPMQLADIAVAKRDARKAVDRLEDLSDEKLSAPEEVFLRLGRAAEAAGDGEKALTAYRRVYYGFPLSEQATDAQEAIERLETPSLASPDRFKQELARAERLFAARRWAEARAGFAPLAGAASGDDRALVALRIAECDYYLDRHRASRDALRPYLQGGPREAEARFFHLTATRALGDLATYVSLARGLVKDHPDTEWAQETLNNLASHYIILDDDAEADLVFRELNRRYPRGRYAERAAWKTGWWSYRGGDYAEAAAIFDSAASNFPRADLRPSWLYWSGRAREQLGEQAVAAARYQLVVIDYQNSYYGREAAKRLEARREPLVQRVAAVERPATPPDSANAETETLIRALAAAGLYDDALNEVQYAQRVWGDSPVLQATWAWIRHQQGLSLKATDRFTALRGAITTMRRAYPQFMAAGGETLPPDVLRIIFPLDYWPLIKKYSDLHKLDPYLIAALMAQESTFTAEIRSHANAYGLMQLIPSTGRRYARKLGIRFSTASLTNAETNVRLGTLYFKELMARFGAAHYALASYNAGEHRVARWRQEAPGLEQDEFIDSIPFAETQAYVKRILGTAEDYRRLYGGGVLTPANMHPGPARGTE